MASTSLADEYPKEQKRVREVLLEYELMRGAPKINVEPAIFMIKAALEEAEQAAAAGDIGRMVRAFQELRDIQQAYECARENKL